MNRTTLPDDMPVMDAGRMASRSGLLLICNGRETCLSADVPPGWAQVAVKIKTMRHAPGATPCAA